MKLLSIFCGNGMLKGRKRSFGTRRKKSRKNLENFYKKPLIFYLHRVTPSISVLLKLTN